MNACFFGTAKRLSKVTTEFTVFYRDTKINPVDEYKYLGNHIDNHLSFKSNFDSPYKKAGNRLRLLEKLRPYLDATAAMNIYEMMVIPLLTYSWIICLQDTKSQLDKFKSLENRARSIVNSECEIPKIRNLILKEA